MAGTPIEKDLSKVRAGDRRAERLATQLRANLKRRKAAARAKDAASGVEAPENTDNKR
jgi:hypothetical protein